MKQLQADVVPVSIVLALTETQLLEGVETGAVSMQSDNRFQARLT